MQLSIEIILLVEAPLLICILTGWNLSLGGLVPGLSLEATVLGASQSRNEKLANLFYRMKLIEAYGTGINKIIRL